MTTSRTLTVGTRTSNLARWQTDHIIALLQAAWPGLACTVQPFVTQGDKTLDRPLPEIGGKGLFTLELENAIRSGEIDFAVHSLKDLPIEEAPGLTLGAIVGRADVRDVLVAREGRTLTTLPIGARVGTSSHRRQAQLLAIRPDLDVASIRGNVETRIRKVMDGQYDAAVLAAAGIERLGLADLVTDWLSLTVMLPAPGQGALAVQCRADDSATLAVLAAIDDDEVRRAVTAERAFLHGLGGGCSAPVAAYATVSERETGQLHLEGLVALPDGSARIQVSGTDDDPLALGRRLAHQALAEGAAAHLAADETPGVPDVMTESRPLQGKRIVITRTLEQAAELSRGIRELGGIPVVVPVIEIAPFAETERLDAAIRRLEGYDWLLFTSQNGVAIFWDRLLQVAPERAALADIHVAAVGTATAEALAGRGRAPDFVPEKFVGEALVAGLGDVSGRSILLPRAVKGRPEIVRLLREQGATVDDIPIYDTLPVEPDSAARQDLAHGVDAITFTSSSTVEYFHAAFGSQSDHLLNGASVVCIGPVTAGTARQLGLRVDIVAEPHTIEGLLAALADHFQKHREIL